MKQNLDQLLSAALAGKTIVPQKKSWSQDQDLSPLVVARVEIQEDIYEAGMYLYDASGRGIFLEWSETTLIEILE